MIIIFLLFTFFSLLSIIGYGVIFNKIFLKDFKNLNLGLVGFCGLLFLCGISYFTHLFTPHNFTHNLIIFIFGVLSFIFFYRKKIILIKKEYIFILLLLLIGIFIGKTHDDFGYYHLPNSLHFSENKLEFGLGNLNHGFKHHSSIFYLYSLFYLPIIKFYLFNVINFFFLIFSTFYLYGNIDDDLKKKKFDYTSLIKTIFLILFISIFNRIGDYGVDIPGQLVVGIFICLIIDLVEKKNLAKQTYLDSIILIMSLLVFLITIKTYFILYVIFPLMIILISSQRKKLLTNFIFSKSFVFLTSVIVLFTIINISATGCVVYPVKNLCFPDFFSWGLNLETINYLSTWYEIWSKAGAGPDFRESDPLIYIQGVNWFSNWIDKYFFTKVSDFLSAIFLGIIITVIVFRKNLSVNLRFKKNIILIYMGILFLTFIWFFKFPSLRYGGSILIISLLVIPFCFLLNIKKNLNLMKQFKILLIISILIFNLKNISRINKEFNYSAAGYFKSFPLFHIENVDFSETLINNEKVYVVKGMCWATPSPCMRNADRKTEIKYGYKIYLNN